MNDSEIAQALKNLPRTNASPRFTRDVLAAVQKSDRRRPIHLNRWFAAAATAFCLVLAIAIHSESVRAEQRRMTALRAEHARIEADLREVKAIASRSRPVVVLENEDTRMVVQVADHPPHMQSNDGMY